MTTLTEKSIIKSRSGVYSDTSENRRKNRVGQKYGADGKSDDNSKDSKKESLTPEKELEAVNKVIQAIAAGKVNLPNAEVVKLYEKRRDLETKVKQATDEKSKEKPESSKKAEPKKESEKKSSKAPEKAKDYEVDGKKYKVWSDFEKRSTLAEDENGTVRALSTSGYVSSDKTIKKVIKERFGAKEPDKKDSGKNSKSEQLDKDIESIKATRDKEPVGSERWKNLNNVWNQLMDKRQNQKLREKQKNEEKESSSSKKEEPKVSETEKVEESEVYTRVKFEDVPNSGKVNMKKYLSEKMKKSADEAWGDISKIDTKGLQKMEKGLVEDFNRQFDDLPKSRRAEKLYAITKVKGELAKRGKESQKTETKVNSVDKEKAEFKARLEVTPDETVRKIAFSDVEDYGEEGKQWKIDLAKEELKNRNNL